ncbi:hypothetical protein SAMN04487987_103447 [Algibacter pectinivorans]|uniref:Uncharacterized protein n=1 Tax=Algibacter pectinivorans TaxID=870482 RepID=A0A1I1PF63_9FLAO|nr:hypothetical protein SAMN04487987_103447 [Algibacter pectinivorans]
MSSNTVCSYDKNPCSFQNETSKKGGENAAKRLLNMLFRVH